MCSEGYCSCLVCVCVYVYVHIFLPPRAYRFQIMNGFTATQKKLFKSFFLLKMLHSEATVSFACLECHQLHLTSQRLIPKESAEGWKDIDIKN